MRVFLWGVLIVALCYGAYSGMIAAWQWLAVTNAVDEIISKASVESVPASELKASIMTAANEAGVPLHEREVNVTREDKAVRVEIIWTVPVIVVKGESVLAVPLSVKRSSR
jgi:hypothetical protein